MSRVHDGLTPVEPRLVRAAGGASNDVRCTVQGAPGLRRRDFLRRAGATGAALALPPLLADCGGTSIGNLMSVTWAVSGGLDSLSFLTQTSRDAELNQTLFLEGLLQLDPQGNIAPWLARSYQNYGNKTYVFQMREGVTWQDGKPFVVDDAVYQYQFNLNPKIVNAASGFFQGFVSSVRKTGESELTIDLAQPLEVFDYWMAIDGSYIMRRDQLANGAYKSVGTPGALPIGTGPYRVTGFTTNSSVVLERYDGHWGPKPKVKKLTLVQIIDDTSRLLAMRSGQIDGTFDVPVQDLRLWRDLSDVEIETSSSLDQWWFTMNTVKAPFDDVHVRRAMAHSLDRAGIVASVWGGNGQPTTNFLPPQEWGELLTVSQINAFYATLPQYPYDLGAAAAELAQSKYPHGFTTSILTTVERPQQALICEIFARSLAKIGINLNVRQVADSDWANEIGNNNPRELGMTINDYPPIGRDPSTNLAIVDPSRTGPNLDNISHYVNKSLIAPFDIIHRGSPSSSAKIAAIKEILRTAARDVPYLPIGIPIYALATKKHLRFNNFSPYYPFSPFAARLGPA